ncbi:MAG TPA: hypothetical protein DD670_16950 [Planctomycetaceae bacterium]|nr:hypothetical protein [Planctomycetaceae bacterium]
MTILPRAKPTSNAIPRQFDPSKVADENRPSWPTATPLGVFETRHDTTILNRPIDLDDSSDLNADRIVSRRRGENYAGFSTGRE